jgi:hypothetical protein
MEFSINHEVDIDNIKLDKIKMHKMVFIYNALDNGWTIKKKHNKFFFYKNHEGKKEVLLDSYLIDFIKSNI